MTGSAHAPASYIEDNMVTIASSFENDNVADNEYKFGFEYGFRNLLFLRAGYGFQPPKSGDRETRILRANDRHDGFTLQDH
jgi:hypothetical protein